MAYWVKDSAQVALTWKIMGKMVIFGKNLSNNNSNILKILLLLSQNYQEISQKSVKIPKNVTKIDPELLKVTF